MPGTGGGSNSQQTKEATQEAAPKVEEAPQKKSFDIWLKAVNPADKLKVIKEFKVIFNLGLKEVR